MNRIIPRPERDKETINRLLQIWESSVRATHLFLSENDIVNIRPEVNQGLASIEHLFCYSDNNEILQGFIGINEQKIEMLFIDANARGQGTGKKLLQYAFEHFQAKYVDVNEQNIQGVGFHTHMGFRVTGRSEHDEMGRPFPLLHLQRGSVQEIPNSTFASL